MTPRPVTVTLAEIRGLTLLEAVRANTLAGVRMPDRARLTAALANQGAADPADVETAFTWLYACAYQLVRRAEPGVTWAEAQTWALSLDLEAVDEAADAEADAVVGAAILTGLPPREAGELRIRELEVYRDVADRARTG